MNSQLAGHCYAVYEELAKRAEMNGKGELVFVGKMTDVHRYLGISSSMYSRIKRILEGAKSIEVLQRGTAAQPSIILLRGEPSAEIFSDSGLTSPRKLATLVGQLEKRVAALETWRESIPINVLQALREHEERIEWLEASVPGESQMGHQTQTKE